MTPSQDDKQKLVGKMRAEPSIEPTRIRNFANFFKSYMSVSALVTAALPIPVASFQLIPTFSDQTKIFSVYTSLFCFLLLGYIFYMRHNLARAFFSREIAARRKRVLANNPVDDDTFYKPTFPSTLLNILPLLLIACSLNCAIIYHGVIATDVAAIRTEIRSDTTNKAMSALGIDTNLHKKSDFINSKTILENVEISNVPHLSSVAPMILYLGMFVLAEAAFILMAIKEYLQDLLGFTEKEIILDRMGAYKPENVGS